MRRAAFALLSALTLACSAPRPLPITTTPPATDHGQGVRCLMDGAPQPGLALPALQRRTASPSRENLRAWVNLLAHPSLRGRPSGSAEERGVAVLLARALASFGVAGAFQDEGYCQPFMWPAGADQNVAGVLRARRAGERPILILGAHYDGQGACGVDGSICPSANDNATGVAALLEVARVLSDRRWSLRADVVFAFFGAEERNVAGSTHFVREPPVPLGRVERMINLDMVGRQLLDGQGLRFFTCAAEDAFGYVVGDRERSASNEAMERAGHAAGVPLFGVPEWMLRRAGFDSDSVPFSPHVPTLFLSTSLSDDYHRPTDTAGKVDFGQVERAVRLVLALVEGG